MNPSFAALVIVELFLTDSYNKMSPERAIAITLAFKPGVKEFGQKVRHAIVKSRKSIDWRAIYQLSFDFRPIITPKCKNFDGITYVIPGRVYLAKENESLLRCALVVFFNLLRLQTLFESSQIKKSPSDAKGFIFFCGENGIRTHEPLLAVTHFPGVRLRPLGHLSSI